MNNKRGVYPKLLLKSKNRGFTLVELMVAIAIVAILAIVGMVVFSELQKKGRDSRRRQDIDALTRAVEQFVLDKGEYPTIPHTLCSLDEEWDTILAPQLVPEYLQSMPKDPKNSARRGVELGQYCFTTNMWCSEQEHIPIQPLDSCSVGIANFWTYQESCSDNLTGDAARFNYAPPPFGGYPSCVHYMKAIFK